MSGRTGETLEMREAPRERLLSRSRDTLLVAAFDRHAQVVAKARQQLLCTRVSPWRSPTRESGTRALQDTARCGQRSFTIYDKVRRNVHS